VPVGHIVLMADDEYGANHQKGQEAQLKQSAATFAMFSMRFRLVLRFV